MNAEIIIRRLQEFNLDSTDDYDLPQEAIALIQGLEERLAAALDHIETLLSCDPEMPTYQADYDRAEAFLEKSR